MKNSLLKKTFIAAILLCTTFLARPHSEICCGHGEEKLLNIMASDSSKILQESIGDTEDLDDNVVTALIKSKLTQLATGFSCLCDASDNFSKAIIFAKQQELKQKIEMLQEELERLDKIIPSSQGDVWVNILVQSQDSPGMMESKKIPLEQYTSMLSTEINLVKEELQDKGKLTLQAKVNVLIPLAAITAAKEFYQTLDSTKELQSEVIKTIFAKILSEELILRLAGKSSDQETSEQNQKETLAAVEKKITELSADFKTTEEFLAWGEKLGIADAQRKLAAEVQQLEALVSSSKGLPEQHKNFSIQELSRKKALLEDSEQITLKINSDILRILLITTAAKELFTAQDAA